TIDQRANELTGVVKTGRTHLMDAMPVTLGQELSGWSAQIEQGIQRLRAVLPRISSLVIGGTAVGTGINAHSDFGSKVSQCLTHKTGEAFSSNTNKFEGLSAQDAAVELSGQLKTIAVSLMKISNDLRWMNSGPLAGLGEIALPALQPGSSIMPGKVNPVIPESMAMVCAQVIGNDATITIAGQSGNFQLNVMLPVIAYNLLQSIEILSNGSRMLADRAIAGFSVNEENINSALDRNPILVTALNSVIGYDLGAKIAKAAYADGRAVIDVAEEMTDLSRDELKRLLDPYGLTQGGIQK
ncbi:MAG: lyase family protein, partial [Gammaproteobacteria bacterium]|nr:lyase family protein [Gammaproteobacteria bacterium]